MAEQDLYDLLGVERGASEAEIKKSYRRLAMELHPDRNSGDERAADKFKKVNVAYDILKDPQKRAAYDQFGHAAFNGSMGGRGPHAGADFGASFSDMFEELFGGMMGASPGGNAARHGGSNRGDDIRYELAINLEAAYSGRKVKIRVPSQAPCDACEATGSANRAAPVTCGSCGGAGIVRTTQGFMTFQRTCPSCGGRGRTIADPCRQCRGLGRSERTRDLEVSIPAGIDDGNRLQLRGEGDAGIRGGPTGDLYILVRVRPDQRFEREGADLSCPLQVPVTTAALGGEIQAPTLDGGSAKVSVPVGTQTGQQLRLRGKGMPKLNARGHGDLYLQVFVETPLRLTRKQRKLLEEFAEEERKAGQFR